MENKSKLDELAHMSLWRLLYNYSMPAVVGMAAMSIYQLVDAYYVGLWCGPFAIAGLAIIFPIVNLMIAIGVLTGMGGAANVSLALGRGDMDLAFRILGHSIQLPLLFNTIIGVALYLYLPEVLQLFGTSKDTFAPAYDFMGVTTLTFPITALFMNMNHITRACGYPKKAMMTLVISVVLNIALAPLFMKVLDLGMMGAAIATCLAQILALFTLIPHYLDQSHVLYLKKGIYKLNGAIIRRICFVGLPPCLVNICGCVIVAILNHSFLSYQGDLAVASYGIVNRFTFVFFMVGMGVSLGLQPIVGYNQGMGYYERVRGALFRAMGAAAAVTTVGFIFSQLFPEFIMGLFVSAGDASSDEIIEFGSHGMRIFTAVMPIIGAQMIIGNFFQSIGKPGVSILLNMLRQVIILIPMLFILPPLMGVNGIWWAIAASDLGAAIACWTALFIYLHRNHKKHDSKLD